MKKLIVTFFVLFIVLILARVVFAFYVETVPVFAVLLTPLMWLGIAAGVLALVFIVIMIIKEIPRRKGE